MFPCRFKDPQTTTFFVDLVTCHDAEMTNKTIMKAVIPKKWCSVSIQSFQYESTNQIHTAAPLRLHTVTK